MTTPFSTSAAVGRAPVARDAQGSVALGAMQVAVGIVFIAAGSVKLADVPAAVAVFDAIGLGQWFRYVVAVIEVTSGLALFVPSLAPYGALLLTVTMAGALVAHQIVLPGSPIPAVLLLMASFVIALARRDPVGAGRGSRSR